MKNNKTPLSIALGTTLLTGLAATGVQAETTIQVETSPFAMTELNSGYMQLAEADTDTGTSKKAEGKCGEGKCGEGKKETPKSEEGKCGEAKCGADKKAGTKTEVGK
ncbi:MAG: low-complexity protein [Methylococcaceae bacterium]|nr:low-complexity protein [Methylococcaceae bacterium]